MVRPWRSRAREANVEGLCLRLSTGLPPSTCCREDGAVKRASQSPRRLWSVHGRRLVAGSLLAAVLVGVLLVVAEGALRLAGVGVDTRFFARSETADGTLMLHPHAGFARLFFASGLERHGRAFAFPAQRPDDGLRILVVGGSAAMGDPDPDFGWARMLEVVLAEAHPERTIEVLNLARTAISSHVCAEIVEAGATADPDVVVLYLGNNEVVGPYGPTAVLTPAFAHGAVIRAHLALKRTRLGQLLLASTRKPAASTWGGMEMFRQHQVRADDPRLTYVYRHYEANLQRMVAAGHAAGATVVIVPPVVNVRDFAPFAAAPAPTLGADERAVLAATLRDAIAAVRTGAGDRAAAHLATAGELAPGHADVWFLRGRLALQRGDLVAAREYLRRARDLDLLRFRADARLQQIAVEVAGATGAMLVPALPSLDPADPTGLPGDDVFFEHVHLNPQGSHRLAGLVAATLATNPDLGLTARPMPPLGAVLQRLGFTDWEALALEEELARRYRAAPFTDHSGSEARLAAATAQADRLRARLATPEGRAATLAAYDAVLAAYPDDLVVARNRARFLEAHGQFAAAETGYAAVLERNPWEREARMGLGRVQWRQGDHGAARATLQALVQAFPRHYEARATLATIALAQNDLASATRHADRLIADQPQHHRGYLLRAEIALADDDRNAARDAWQAARQRSPDHPDVQRLAPILAPASDP